MFNLDWVEMRQVACDQTVIWNTWKMTEKTRTKLNFDIRLFICLLPVVFPIPSLQEGLIWFCHPRT